MRYEKSVGAIIFREKRASTSRTGVTPIREYLLLAHPSMGKGGKIIWDFPKGLVAEAEEEKETAEREVREETGLTEFSFLSGFRESVKIFYKFQGEFISKTAVYFLAQATEADVRLSFEHTDFVWLPVTMALERLSFKNSKDLLRRCELFLNRPQEQTSLNL